MCILHEYFRQLYETTHAFTKSLNITYRYCYVSLRIQKVVSSVACMSKCTITISVDKYFHINQNRIRIVETLILLYFNMDANIYVSEYDNLGSRGEKNCESQMLQNLFSKSWIFCCQISKGAHYTWHIYIYFFNFILSKTECA